jgi:hypothetical protein
MMKFFARRILLFWIPAISVLAVIVLFFLSRKLNPELPEISENNSSNNMKLTSPLFANNDGFPEMCTCDGKEVSPPLEIAGVPARAKSLALVLRDPDAAEGTFIHWIMWNIDPKTEHIKTGHAPESAVFGKTTDGKIKYVGPCPPHGTHRYIFTLYALDAKLYLNEGAAIEQFNAAIAGHILAQTQLLAKFR